MVFEFSSHSAVLETQKKATRGKKTETSLPVDQRFSVWVALCKLGIKATLASGQCLFFLLSIDFFNVS